MLQALILTAMYPHGDGCNGFIDIHETDSI